MSRKCDTTGIEKLKRAFKTIVCWLFSNAVNGTFAVVVSAPADPVRKSILQSLNANDVIAFLIPALVVLGVLSILSLWARRAWRKFM